MVDTNVWVDLYVPGRPNREASIAFFEEAKRSQAELVFTLEIARAVFRIVPYEAKRWVRQQAGELSETFAHAIANTHGTLPKVVHPQVYVAFAIEGAVQHLAGMKDADRIAAVNTDRKAHIFDHADIGVTCDWLETAKALLMKLRAE